MISVNTNITSLVVQNHFTLANDCIQTSLERLSTGFKINRAADDAANLSVSKNMECQISGSKVALDNAQQAINLVQTADSAMGEMQDIAQRIRELALQSANGTYSDQERAMIQQEVSSLVDEIYKQRNNAKFNEIFIFGEQELPPHATNAGDSTNSANPSVDAISTPPLLGNSVNTANTGGAVPAGVNGTGDGVTFDPTHIYKTDQEAIDAGYTADHLIHNETELQNIINTQKQHFHKETEWGDVYDFDYLEGKYCLMGDIDFSKISGWGNIAIGCFDEDMYETVTTGDFNGNGYTISNLTINDSVNSDAHGLFFQVVGSVENLNLDNVNIFSNNDYIGALAGNMYGSSSAITNCSASGSVTGNENTGGLVGYAYEGSITNCSASGSVTGNNYTGGLVGLASGSITNSSASGSVTGNARTGGLVGHASGSITNSSASGSVTGNSETGGLVGLANGSITNSSASGSVTGNARTGGLVGYASGSIDKSYATGDVEGVGIVGGLVGYNYNASISNSYSLSNVSATGDYVGGAVGQNRKTLEKCYSAGNVTGTGTHVGGFAGEAASLSSNKITDCYTTNQELDFYGANTKGGTVSGCHGANDQTGVTGHEPEWFNDPDNIKPILGETNFDYKVMPPDIKGNERPVPPPPPPPPPTEEGIQFQIGANSGEENTLTINTNFSLNGFDADVTTREKANETIDKVDALISEFSIRRSGYGAVQNRLESVMDSLTTKTNNLSASHSTIVDTDFAAESANLVKAQILQNATAALLAQANSAPSIALRLLE